MICDQIFIIFDGDNTYVVPKYIVWPILYLREYNISESTIIKAKIQSLHILTQLNIIIPYFFVFIL